MMFSAFVQTSIYTAVSVIAIMYHDTRTSSLVLIRRHPGHYATTVGLGISIASGVDMRLTIMRRYAIFTRDVFENI